MTACPKCGQPMHRETHQRKDGLHHVDTCKRHILHVRLPAFESFDSARCNAEARPVLSQDFYYACSDYHLRLSESLVAKIFKDVKEAIRGRIVFGRRDFAQFKVTEIKQPPARCGVCGTEVIDGGCPAKCLPVVGHVYEYQGRTTDCKPMRIVVRSIENWGQDVMAEDMSGEIRGEFSLVVKVLRSRWKHIGHEGMLPIMPQLQFDIAIPLAFPMTMHVAESKP